MLASDDSDTSDSSGTVGCSGKGRSRGKDGALTSGTGSAGSHSALEGPRKFDPDKGGKSTALPSSKIQVESGEESA